MFKVKAFTPQIKILIEVLTCLFCLLFSVKTSSHGITFLTKMCLTVCLLEMMTALFFRLREIKEFIKTRKLIIWVLIAIATIFLCRALPYTWKTYASLTSMMMIRFVLILMATGFCTSIFFIILLKPPFYLSYFLIALCMGTSFLLVIPVGQVPDEPVHSQCAYRVSNRILGINPSETSNGYYLRENDKKFPVFSNVTENDRDWYWKQLSKKTEDIDIVFTKDALSLASENLYVYFVSGLGIAIGRLLHFNAVSVFTLGRFFNFFFFLIISTWCIKIIPWGKEILFVILMFPVSLQQNMSFSYDLFINAMSLLALSEGLYLGDNEESVITLKALPHWILLFAGICLVIPLKGHAYFSLVLILLYIAVRRNRVNSKKVKAILSVLIIAVIAVVLLGFIYAHIHPFKEPYYRLGYINEQKFTLQYIFNHPRRSCQIVVNTFNVAWFGYYSMMVSGPLGWLNVGLDQSVVVGFSVILLCSLFITSNNLKKEIGGCERLIFLLIFLISLFCVVCGMWLQWTPLSSGVIQGVQGRYFLPVFAFLAFALVQKKHSDMSNYLTQLVPPAAVLMDFIALTSVI